MLFGQGIHRVAVVDDYDNLLHVVTQSTVIFFFKKFVLKTKLSNVDHKIYCRT